jgi:hypothetical protein
MKLLGQSVSRGDDADSDTCGTLGKYSAIALFTDVASGVNYVLTRAQTHGSDTCTNACLCAPVTALIWISSVFLAHRTSTKAGRWRCGHNNMAGTNQSMLIVRMPGSLLRHWAPHFAAVNRVATADDRCGLDRNRC